MNSRFFFISLQKVDIMKYLIDFRTFKWAVYTLLCMNLYYTSTEKFWIYIASVTAVAYIVTLIKDTIDYFKNK